MLYTQNVKKNAMAAAQSFKLYRLRNTAVYLTASVLKLL